MEVTEVVEIPPDPRGVHVQPILDAVDEGVTMNDRDKLEKLLVE